MSKKLPYYIAYSFFYPMEEDKMELRDLSYMKGMYPLLAKKLLPYVEEQCQRMDYKGSMIYDEYPDQVSLRRACVQILEQVEDYEDAKTTYEMIFILMCQRICEMRSQNRWEKRRRVAYEKEYYPDRDAGRGEKHGGRGDCQAAGFGIH